MDPQVVDRIRKLLDLARSAGDTAEGRSARAKAEARMAAAGLTEDQVLSYQVVVLEGRARIWEQALAEMVAQTHGCGLRVDRRVRTWSFHGSASATGAAVDQFRGVHRQLTRSSADYLSVVREAMRAEGDDPAEARSILDRAGRAFLEAATASVVGRLLEELLGREEEPEAEGEAGDSSSESDRKPFDALMKRVDQADLDWDDEILLPDHVPDPWSAGAEAGDRTRLEPPWGDELPDLARPVGALEDRP